MTAELFIYDGIALKVDKREALQSIKVYSDLKPFEPFNVETPRLIVEYDERLVACNYAKVDDYYYFVTSPAYQNGSRLIFKLEKDVLMSNLEELLDARVITDRNATQFNSYIYDDRQLGQVNYTTFSAALGSWDYLAGWTVLVVIGGDSDAV